MRRSSDRRPGQRNGHGRRVRDRLLSGGRIVASHPDAEEATLLLGDDLRESALALSSLEAFVVRAQAILAEPAPTPLSLRTLARDPQTGLQLELLADALTSLRRGLGALADGLERD